MLAYSMALCYNLLHFASELLTTERSIAVKPHPLAKHYIFSVGNEGHGYYTVPHVQTFFTEECIYASPESFLQ
jgi:hypothetical protein